MPNVADLVAQAAQDQGVDPELAVEVARQESGLNQSAVSPAGAIGVMQLMPATAADVGVDPTDLEQNILGGVRYLGEQLAQFGDVREALAAYNWGPERVAGAIAEWGDSWIDHAPAETRNYVASILGRLGSVGSTIQAQAVPIGLIAAGAVGLYFLVDAFS